MKTTYEARERAAPNAKGEKFKEMWKVDVDEATGARQEVPMGRVTRSMLTSLISQKEGEIEALRLGIAEREEEVKALEKARAEFAA